MTVQNLPNVPATNWLTGRWLDCVPRSLIAVSGTPPIPGGKYYFEVTFNNGGSSTGIYVGLSQASPPISLFDFCDDSTSSPQSGMAGTIGFTFVGGGEGSVPQGRGYPTNPKLGSLLQAAPSISDVVAFAVDTTTSQLWVQDVTTASGWYGSSAGTSGNPVTSTNGATFGAGGNSPISGAFQILLGAFGSNGPSIYGKGTINFGHISFVGSVPSGYVALNTDGTVTLNPSDNSNLNLTGSNFSWDNNGVSISGSGTPINGVRASGMIS